MKKALVVDDSSTMRKLIGSIVKATGMFSEIVEAEDGKQALEKIKEHDISFITSDFNMPEMNGAEFVANVRKEPKFGSIPIIVISTDEKSRDEAKKAGASGWLKKPFQPETLTNAINKLCNSWS